MMINIYTYNNIITHNTYTQYTYNSIMYKVCVYMYTCVCSTIHTIYGDINNVLYVIDSIVYRAYSSKREKCPNIVFIGHLKGDKQFKHIQLPCIQIITNTLIYYCHIILIMLNTIRDVLCITACLFKSIIETVAMQSKGFYNTIDLDSYIDSYIETLTNTHDRSFKRESCLTDSNFLKWQNGALPICRNFLRKNLFRDTITLSTLYTYTQGRIRTLTSPFTTIHIWTQNLIGYSIYVYSILFDPKFLEIFLSKNLFTYYYVRTRI